MLQASRGSICVHMSLVVALGSVVGFYYVPTILVKERIVRKCPHLLQLWNSRNTMGTYVHEPVASLVTNVAIICLDGISDALL